MTHNAEEHLVMIRKYLRPKEIEEVYGIKTSTLARQRWGKYGPPATIVRKPKSKRGLILYNVDDSENYLHKHTS